MTDRLAGVNGRCRETLCGNAGGAVEGPRKTPASPL